MTTRAPSPLCSPPLAKSFMALVAVCLAGHVSAMTAPVDQPNAASAAPTEVDRGTDMRSGKAPGNSATLPKKSREEVSRGPVKPKHYPSSPLPPVPAPPTKR